MTEQRIRLTASEMTGLWASYLNNTMSVCMFQHFLQHVDDPDVRSIVEYTLESSRKNVEKLLRIYQKEKQTIPIGFTDSDVNLAAPRLFSDAIYLYYIKQMSKVTLSTYGIALATSAHPDVRAFLSEGLYSTTELYNKVAELLLSKGLFIRSPYVSTAQEAEYVTKQSYLGGFLQFDPRPLNVIEITHIKANSEANLLGQFLLTGFSQVAKSKKVRQYLVRGKQIAQKHVQIFSTLLVEDDVPAGMEWDMQVSDSTSDTFSDKLIMFFSTALIASGISNYATASAASFRRDIATTYTRLTAEIAQYSVDGVELMVDNGWLEEPPQNLDRKALANI